MSWVAHDLEPYILHRKLRTGVAISFVALVIGSWGPDMFTKWFVHGLSFAGLEIHADDPVQFHRGWPGAGFTHSLAFGVAVGAIVYALTRSRAWGLGLTLGLWLHALSDVADTVGVMLFFPLTTHAYSLGLWANADVGSRGLDAAAYYSGPGMIWFLGADRSVAARGCVTRALPWCRVLRSLPLHGVDAVGTCPPPLPGRSELGRPALGARRSPALSQ